jgi:AraC-like DNA-binding protein
MKFSQMSHYAAQTRTKMCASRSAWLGRSFKGELPKRSRWLTGGLAISNGNELARLWFSPAASEARLRAETHRILRAVSISAPGSEKSLRSSCAWLFDVKTAIEEQEADTRRLAHALARHPAYLARAYRTWRGEGIAETARRRRIERAVVLLRHDDSALAGIATQCGFCDQSHMNRAFRTVLNRTPVQVRSESALLTKIDRDEMR